MKKVRECFHMLITAVICLMVSMVPGKNVTAAIVENNVASEILSTRVKRKRMWKKLFFWLQGPGDRKTKTVSLLYRNKKTVFGSA